MNELVNECREKAEGDFIGRTIAVEMLTIRQKGGMIVA